MKEEAPRFRAGGRMDEHTCEAGSVDEKGTLGPLAEVTSDAVLSVRGGRIASANDRWTDMICVGEETPARQAALTDGLVDIGAGLPDSAGRAGDSVECRIVRSDGRERTLIFRLARTECSHAPAMFTVEDVTHTRELESQLLDQSRELAAAHRDAEAQREKLRHERADRQQLLQMVSHELRTPVTFITGYNHLLLSEEVGPLTEEQRRFLTECTKGCQRLSAFIGNLLEASREIEAGEVLEVGTERVEDVLEEVAGLFARMLEEQEVRLCVEVEPAKLRVSCDRLRVEQVLTNLVTNALKVTKSGGLLEFSAKGVCVDGRAMVEISVADDGPGIDAADRERIFEPYVQGADSRQAGGLGLGLAICRRLVAAHGGEIWSSEREGGGALFVFTLPQPGANQPNESNQDALENAQERV